MITNELEDAIRGVLHRQAQEMESSAPTPVHGSPEQIVDSGSPSRWNAGGRGGWVLAAAACMVVVLGFVVYQADSDDGNGGNQSTAAASGEQAFQGDKAYSLQTKTVRLEASSVTVQLDQSYPYPSEVPPGGDPGDDEYTTLELKWRNDDNVQMRIYMYFTANGSEWWVDEIRTYYDQGWASTQEGEWFRSPLGEAYTGELRLPSLVLEDLVLQGFLPIDGCGEGVPGFILDPSQFSVTLRGSYGFNIRLRDKATCQELDASLVTMETAVTGSAVAAFDRELWREEKIGMAGGSLSPRGAGETTLVVVAYDSSGVEVARTEVELVVPEDWEG